MSKIIDITGRRFGRLIVLRYSHRAPVRITMWVCLCDCGNETVVAGGHLKNGHTISCGCRKREILDAIGPSVTTHGHNKKGAMSKTYRSWAAMKTRVLNPKGTNWKEYGGRGIKMCERWHDFETFLADMGERPPELTLDRINNDGNYEPGNCRWATHSEQARNRRRLRNTLSFL